MDQIINQIVINCESPEEYKTYRDILAMIVTAKAHGFAEIKVIIKDHSIKQGDVTLQTRWQTLDQ